MMALTVTLFIWWLPIAATLAIWTVALLWPLPQEGGDAFGVVGLLTAVAHALFALFATLLTWLAFFALMWGLG